MILNLTIYIILYLLIVISIYFYDRNIVKKLNEKLEPGFISKLYAPKDSNNIKEGERVFFTTSNAE